MQSPENGENKSQLELLEANAIHSNEEFVAALDSATTFIEVREIIKDHAHVIKNEEGEFDSIVGYVYTNAEGKQAVNFFDENELLALVAEIEKNPVWSEKGIVKEVEHATIADALIRIAAQQ